MNKNGPIVVVEDDKDDQDLLKQVFTELNVKNEVLMFDDGLQAAIYFDQNSINPFIIISDINMPKMNGMELRDRMQKEGAPRLRSVPFIFLTTGAAANTTIEAYLNSVQGFFTKQASVSDFRTTMKRIVDYWGECTAPNFH
jgi:CheY-like chemotaxis protein